MMLADLDAGDDRHVTLHELIHGDRLVNRMDLSYRTLLRVADLVLAYPGQVHPLLANHEIAQCFRMRVSKGAGDQVQMFDEGLDFVFGDDAQVVADSINAFIRAMPLALRCDNGLFLAHSVPAEAFDAADLERELTDADIHKIVSTYHTWKDDDLAWRRAMEKEGATLPAEPGSGYADIPGFCKSATTAEIAAHGHVLTPGRYVGAEEVEDDGDPFEEKMPRLVAELHAQFAESAKLEQAIKANLRGLGYGG